MKNGDAMIYAEETHLNCVFEEYDREQGQMVSCGKQAYGQLKQHPLCEFHWHYSLGVHGLNPKHARTGSPKGGRR